MINYFSGLSDKQLQKKFIFVVGPTASGKSQWALELAQKTNGAIVNCDSVQLYEDLRIGAAAPTDTEKKQVPHFLYSYVKAPAEMTAGQYVRDFYAWIQSEDHPGPFYIVGGTGFYLQALEKGMYNVPEISEDLKQEILHELDERGIEPLFEELKAFDPATELHVNDHYRICRALEVKRAVGKRMSELKAESEAQRKNIFPFSSMKIGFQIQSEDKALFAQRIQIRAQHMLENGMIEEVQSLFDRHLEHWSPLGSVGYREVCQYIKGHVDLQRLPSEITASTMKLVKKQQTWFKRDDSILWSDPFKQDRHEIEEKVLRFLSR